MMLTLDPPQARRIGVRVPASQAAHKDFKAMRAALGVSWELGAF